MSMKAYKILLGAVAMSVGVVGAATAADWPSGPVEIIVPYGAGGGTDTTARFLAQIFQEKFNQPFSVVNRTGGGGIIGLEALVNAKPDGSTLGIVSSDLSTFKWFGQTQLSYRDVDMVGVYNYVLPVLAVAEDSPFKNGKEAFEAWKADPKKYKLHVGSSIGNSYHISFVGIASEYGLNPGAVPSVTGKGAVDALQEVAAGAVDFALTSLSEGEAMMSAGKVRPLFVLGRDTLPAMPDLPTAKEALGIDWQFAVFRAMAAPKGIDAETLEEIRAAFKEVYADERFKEMMAAQGHDTYTVPDDEIIGFVDASETNAGDALKQIGVVK